MVIYYRKGLVKCKRTPSADKKRYARNGKQGGSGARQCTVNIMGIAHCITGPLETLTTYCHHRWERESEPLIPA